jgi:hypothetical protein
MTPRLRATLAGIAGIVAGLAFRGAVGSSDHELVLWLPIVALVIAAVAAQIGSLGAQLLARAAWWANLVLGVLLCILGGWREQLPGVVMAAACGAALVLADRRLLATAADARGFRPAAFAGTIELVMILALADAQTLLFFAGLHYSDRSFRYEHTWLLFLGAACALVVGFVGLYRLRLWGVIVTMVTAVSLALGLLMDLVHTEKDIRTALVVLACAQILAPIPMFFSIVTDKRLPAPSPRVRSAMATVAVVGISILGVLVGLFRHRWQP